GGSVRWGSVSRDVGTNVLHRRSATGGFGATVWQRTSLATSSRDIFTTFDRVKKNQKAWRDHSLLDNLKPAKGKPVAVIGRVVLQLIPQPGNAGFSPPMPPLMDPDPAHVNYRTGNGRSYHDFICLDNNDSPPDGDLNFQIRVNRTELNAQILFWDDGWETNHGITPANFKAKLDQLNQLHVESILYGGTTECGEAEGPAIELPGWQQAGAKGVLLNGQPIAGQLDMVDRDPKSARVNSILGHALEFGTHVRVTGVLVLDCGHGPE